MGGEGKGVGIGIDMGFVDGKGRNGGIAHAQVGQWGKMRHGSTATREDANKVM